MDFYKFKASLVCIVGFRAGGATLDDPIWKNNHQHHHHNSNSSGSSRDMGRKEKRNSIHGAFKKCTIPSKAGAILG